MVFAFGMQYIVLQVSISSKFAEAHLGAYSSAFFANSTHSSKGTVCESNAHFWIIEMRKAISDQRETANEMWTRECNTMNSNADQ